MPFLPALHAYFNPRSPRGGATYTRGLMVGFVPISIHAPHEGERLAALGMGVRVWAFQSTLPTRGSDLHLPRVSQLFCHFNPRSPRGGATVNQPFYVTQPIFQSTLPTRGSDRSHYTGTHFWTISIHAPHEGERLGVPPHMCMDLDFNPRSPRGGATPASCKSSVQRYISIHAPHEGERRLTSPMMRGENVFQSTLPTRGSDV